MLLERRIYTLQPGKRHAFMQAQIDRGFELIAPIAQRLVGYFVDERDDGDRIVHLYRFDDFADWQQRLHGLYGVPALSPYFASVRAVMQRQENDFFFPAPNKALTPHWGNGNDWLPAQGALFTPQDVETLRIVQDTLYLRPGKTPAFFASVAEHSQSTTGLLGWFISVTGRLHRAVRYWVHEPTLEPRAPSAKELALHMPELVADHESTLLSPVLEIPPMSPMLFTT